MNVAKAALTLTAQPNTKTYDGTNSAAASPTKTGLIAGDTVTGLGEAYAGPSAGTGLTLAVTPVFVVNDGNGGNNYTVSTVANTAGIINQLAVTLTGARGYDGTATALGSILSVANLIGADSVTLSGAGTLAGKNAGTENIVSAGTLSLGGLSGANYTLTGFTGSVNVAKAALTLTAQPNTKTYDGTNSAAATPATTGLIAGDTVTGLGEAYAGPSAGTGLTLAVTPVFVVNDGNGGNNYTVSTVANTAGIINQLAVTLTGARGYDGTATALGSILSAANLVSGDVLTFSGSAALASKNAGTEGIASTAGLSLGGASAGNYTLTGVSGSVNVAKAALTLTAQANTKTYDGTNSAAATPATTGLFTGDTVTGLGEAYAGPSAGTGLTLAVTPVFVVNDGNGGNNYTVSTVANTAGIINQLAVTLTGARGYDGTATALGSILSVANLIGADSVTLSGAGTLAGKNAGTENIVSAGTLSLGGLSGANYTLTGFTGSVNVAKAALTLTAQPNTKTYDGTNSAAASPTKTGLIAGDTVTGLGEAYAGPSAGTGLTLAVTPVFVVNDGNGGNNYTVSTVANTAGIINQLAVTLTGARGYDGTATALGSILSVANLIGADSVTLSGAGTLAGKNAGTENIVSAGTLSLGGLSGANYTLTGFTGSVNVAKAALTLTAQPNTKTYDGTNSAAASPTKTGLIAGDTVTGLGEAYAGPSAGTGLTLAVTPVFVVNDGNGGNNYTVSTVANTAGIINQLAVTLTGARGYDGTATALGSILSVANLIGADSVTLSGAGTLAGKNAGTENIVSAGTLSLGGLSGANYTLTGFTGSVNVAKAALTLTAQPNTKTYDGTNSAAASPTKTGLIAGDTVTGLGEAYAGPSAGTGLTLAVTPVFVVNDGNGGNNYTVSTVANTAGIINQLAVTLTGARGYDGTATALGLDPQRREPDRRGRADVLGRGRRWRARTPGTEDIVSTAGTLSLGGLSAGQLHADRHDRVGARQSAGGDSDRQPHLRHDRGGIVRHPHRHEQSRRRQPDARQQRQRRAGERQRRHAALRLGRNPRARRQRGRQLHARRARAERQRRHDRAGDAHLRRERGRHLERPGDPRAFRHRDGLRRLRHARHGHDRLARLRHHGHRVERRRQLPDHGLGPHGQFRELQFCPGAGQCDRLYGQPGPDRGGRGVLRSRRDRALGRQRRPHPERHQRRERHLGRGRRLPVPAAGRDDLAERRRPLGLSPERRGEGQQLLRSGDRLGHEPRYLRQRVPRPQCAGHAFGRRLRARRDARQHHQPQFPVRRQRRRRARSRRHQFRARLARGRIHDRRDRRRRLIRGDGEPHLAGRQRDDERRADLCRRGRCSRRGRLGGGIEHYLYRHDRRARRSDAERALRHGDDRRRRGRNDAARPGHDYGERHRARQRDRDLVRNGHAGGHRDAHRQRDDRH